MKTGAAQSVSDFEVSLTHCCTEDFDEVFPLLQQLWPNKVLDRGGLRNLFREALPENSRVLLSARLNAKVVGFCSMTLKPHLWHGGLIAWVDELVVDAECRGRGIGKRLLDRMVTLAREKGCRAMELDSAFHRIEAHDFYEKLGFEKRAFLFAKNIAG